MVKPSQGYWRNPLRIWRYFRYLIRQPRDFALTLRLGYFIWSVPRRLDHNPLPVLLKELQAASRPSCSDWQCSYELINRLSRPWFLLPSLQSYNTCYLRSLMLFGFLDSGNQPLRIHFVVESPRTREDRLRGHAWVTAGDVAIEPPQPEILARTRSIYSFPQWSV